MLLFIERCFIAVRLCLPVIFLIVSQVVLVLEAVCWHIFTNTSFCGIFYCFACLCSIPFIVDEVGGCDFFVESSK